MSIPTYDPKHQCDESLTLCRVCAFECCEGCAAKWDVDGVDDMDRGMVARVKAQCVRCFWEEMGPKLYAALKDVEAMAVVWEPLTAGDISDYRKLLRKIERD